MREASQVGHFMGPKGVPTGSLGPFGLPLGTLGLPWGTPWATIGPPWAPFGLPMDPLGPTLGFQKEPMRATRLSIWKMHSPIVFWSILLPLGAVGTLAQKKHKNQQILQS